MRAVTAVMHALLSGRSLNSYAFAPPRRCAVCWPRLAGSAGARTLLEKGALPGGTSTLRELRRIHGRRFTGGRRKLLPHGPHSRPPWLPVIVVRTVSEETAPDLL